MIKWIFKRLFKKQSRIRNVLYCLKEYNYIDDYDNIYTYKNFLNLKKIYLKYFKEKYDSLPFLNYSKNNISNYPYSIKIPNFKKYFSSHYNNNIILGRDFISLQIICSLLNCNGDDCCKIYTYEEKENIMLCFDNFKDFELILLRFYYIFCDNINILENEKNIWLIFNIFFIPFNEISSIKEEIKNGLIRFNFNESLFHKKLKTNIFLDIYYRGINLSNKIKYEDIYNEKKYNKKIFKKIYFPFGFRYVDSEKVDLYLFKIFSMINR
jgi:hypothetical protein